MDYKQKAKELVAQMTLEEKASLCSGKDFWHTKGVQRLGVQEQMLTDGPHGLRKQSGAGEGVGLSDSVPSTSFPTACASACTFDRQLMHRMGTALGEKCCEQDVSVILGPGINMKRSPLCGRNFEYFSEDPMLAGEMAAALIEGVQEQGVGTSLKHFATNNQETNRLIANSVVDERALREIYLAGFERAVKKAQPWTVMCSYNRLNGEYVSDSRLLLADILRREWGFEGLVVSDWGAVNERVKGVQAGLDLEMPAIPPYENDALLVASVKDGTLAEEDLNTCARRVTEMLLRGQNEKKKPAHGDKEHNDLAREIALASAVLLKNDGALPLAKTAKVAFIGEMAKTPRYQGAGSSQICPAFLDNALDSAMQAGYTPLFARGYDLASDTPDNTLIDEAVACAKQAEVAVVFAGLPALYESEGFDRKDINMPASHNALIAAVAAANPHTVVVLQCGAPVAMPWLGSVQAVLLQYLSGQASGSAAVQLLYGDAVPCGKLGESWPAALEDTPCADSFCKDPRVAQYRESIFIGYRYYDKAAVKPAFPFGYGLSYTTFAYSCPVLKQTGENSFTVTVSVTNTGTVAGAEIAQLYVGYTGESKIMRPLRELRGFEKISLASGETGTVTFTLDKRSFAYYNTAVKDWCVEGGEYTVYVGPSSADLPLSATLTLLGDGKEDLAAKPAVYMAPQLAAPFAPTEEDFAALLGHAVPHEKRGERPFTLNSTLDDIRDTGIGKKLLKKMEAMTRELEEKGDIGMSNMARAMMFDTPLRSAAMLGTGITTTQAKGIVDMANGHTIRGFFKLMKKG